MKTKKLIIGAMSLALSLVLPQMFHLVGMQQSGAIFLPMHIPVFIGGMLLGPVYGTIVGALAPLFSWGLTGMPSNERVAFMIVELASYGMLSGFLFQMCGLKDKKFGAMITQIVAMLFGRFMYAIMLIVATHILGIPAGGLAAVVTAIVTGMPGIIIQLLFVPAIVVAITKTNILDQRTSTQKI